MVNTKSKQPQTTQLWHEAKDTHARDSQAESRVSAQTIFIWSAETLSQEQIN